MTFSSLTCTKEFNGEIIVSCDFSVIYYPVDKEDDYYKYVRFNKKQNTFTWEERKLSRNINEKLDWLRDNVEDYWNEIKGEYRKLKNSNHDSNKHSFVLYYEAVSNVCNWYRE